MHIPGRIQDGLCSINRFKEIDRRGVYNPSLYHRHLEIGRSSEVLGLLGVLSVEDDHDLALVAVGGVVDSWIDKARRPLYFDMPIEDRTPMAIVPHLMTDDHHSHGILLLPVSLVATFILPAHLAR